MSRNKCFELKLHGWDNSFYDFMNEVQIWLNENCSGEDIYSKNFAQLESYHSENRPKMLYSSSGMAIANQIAYANGKATIYFGSEEVFNWFKLYFGKKFKIEHVYSIIEYPHGRYKDDR